MPTMYQKRFRCDGDVWRLRIEGSEARVDEWCDGWAIYAEGRIADGRIRGLQLIDLGELSPQRPIPDGMLAAANATLLLIADGDAGRATRMTSKPKPMSRVGFYGQAAVRLGITFEEYTEKRAQGLRWCQKGRHWSNLPMSTASYCQACLVQPKEHSLPAGSRTEKAA